MREVAQKVFEKYSDLPTKIATPKVQQYAFEQASELAGYGEIPLQAAEEVIKKYNSILKPFYEGKAVGLDDISKAHVDAKTASAIRESLDDIIMKTTGKSYQDLKSRYGAVVDVEKNLVNQLEKMTKTINIPGVSTLDTVPILYGAFTGNTPLVVTGISP
jgi:hypothetical protein